MHRYENLLVGNLVGTSLERPKTLVFSKLPKSTAMSYAAGNGFARMRIKPNGGVANLLDTVALTPHIVHRRAY
jgi:hypothetical protein